MFTIKVIKTEQQYQAALKEVEQLMDLNPDINTPESDRLELLAVLIEDYEDRIIDMGMPDRKKVQAVRWALRDLKNGFFTNEACILAIAMIVDMQPVTPGDVEWATNKAKELGLINKNKE